MSLTLKVGFPGSMRSGENARKTSSPILALFARNVRPVGATGGEGREAVGVGVEPGDGEPGLGEFDGQREADVPLADDGDLRAVSRDASPPRRGVIDGRPIMRILSVPHHSNVTFLVRFLAGTPGWYTAGDHGRSGEIRG